jgi:hypothetical protein
LNPVAANGSEPDIAPNVLTELLGAVVCQAAFDSACGQQNGILLAVVVPAVLHINQFNPALV